MNPVTHLHTYTHTLHPPILFTDAHPQVPHAFFHAWKGILTIIPVARSESGWSRVESSFSGDLSRDTPIHSIISWLLCLLIRDHLLSRKKTSFKLTQVKR